VLPSATSTAVVLGLLGRRTEEWPAWIALGASLKGPLLLALVYAGRGEWRRAALTLGLTVVLVAPAFLFDLSRYSTSRRTR
jgi:hypothetical protein